MPKKKLRNLSFTDRELINKVRWALKNVDFGTAIYDLVTGTDEATYRAERILAHFSNTGLSIVVGNSTMAIVNVGKTMFFNVGGTNVFGSDGVNSFVVVGGQTYAFAIGPGTTNAGLN